MFIKHLKYSAPYDWRVLVMGLECFVRALQALSESCLLGEKQDQSCLALPPMWRLSKPIGCSFWVASLAELCICYQLPTEEGVFLGS